MHSRTERLHLLPRVRTPAEVGLRMSDGIMLFLIHHFRMHKLREKKAFGERLQELQNARVFLP